MYISIERFIEPKLFARPLLEVVKDLITYNEISYLVKILELLHNGFNKISKDSEWNEVYKEITKLNEYQIKTLYGLVYIGFDTTDIENPFVIIINLPNERALFISNNNYPVF